TDIIADMLTRIRNAVMAKKDSVVVPSFKLAGSMLEILKNEGSIENFKEQASAGPRKTIKVYLKYASGKKPILSGVKRVSRSGLRVYSKCKNMPTVLRGFGYAIVSTSQGLMTDAAAREKKLGGEIICYVW
ncbi:30S ribosomal protein S8, partial [bacterium]